MPNALALGYWLAPTGNRLLGAINLNYLKSEQIRKLRKVLKAILKQKGLRRRYRLGARLLPDVFQSGSSPGAYRTYRTSEIGHITPGTLRFWNPAKDLELADKILEKHQEEQRQKEELAKEKLAAAVKDAKKQKKAERLLKKVAKLKKAQKLKKREEPTNYESYYAPLAIHEWPDPEDYKHAHLAENFLSEPDVIGRPNKLIALFDLNESKTYLDDCPSHAEMIEKANLSYSDVLRLKNVDGRLTVFHDHLDPKTIKANLRRVDSRVIDLLGV
jgi:hypothetical protein